MKKMLAGPQQYEKEKTDGTISADVCALLLWKQLVIYSSSASHRHLGRMSTAEMHFAYGYVQSWVSSHDELIEFSN